MFDGLFAKFSLTVIGACDVAKNKQIYLTKASQQIQEINRQFDETLNDFGPMVFESNQKQN